MGLPNFVQPFQWTISSRVKCLLVLRDLRLLTLWQIT